MAQTFSPSDCAIARRSNCLPAATIDRDGPVPGVAPCTAVVPPGFGVSTVVSSSFALTGCNISGESANRTDLFGVSIEGSGTDSSVMFVFVSDSIWAPSMFASASSTCARNMLTSCKELCSQASICSRFNELSFAMSNAAWASSSAASVCRFEYANSSSNESIFSCISFLCFSKSCINFPICFSKLLFLY